MTKLHQVLYKTALVWKIAFASGLSWEIAKLAGSSHPYLAPLSVILCLQVTVNKSISYGLQRVLGTFAGVLVTAYLIPFIEINAWSLGILLFVASAIVYLMGLNKTIINQVTLSILLVLTFESHPDYGIDRVRDTLIGCLIAVLFNMLIFPPNFTGQALIELRNYSEKITRLYKDTGNWLQKDFTTNHGQTLLKKVDGLFDELAKTISQFNTAEESLRYHPFTKKSHKQLRVEQRKLMVINRGLTHLVNIIETLLEWHDCEEITHEEMLLWGERMNIIAEYYSTWRDSYLDRSLPSNQEKITKDLLSWSTNFKRPVSEKAYRFAYALQNDTIQSLLEFQDRREIRKYTKDSSH